MIHRPIKINKLKLNNRLIISPMCQYSADNGKPSNWHYKHLGSLIDSGASILVLESTAVSREGRITVKDLCLYNNEQKESFKKLIKFLKSIKNIPIFIQLSHSGKKDLPKYHGLNLISLYTKINGKQYRLLQLKKTKIGHLQKKQQKRYQENNKRF